MPQSCNWFLGRSIQYWGQVDGCMCNTNRWRQKGNDDCLHQRQLSVLGRLLTLRFCLLQFAHGTYALASVLFEVSQEFQDLSESFISSDLVSLVF